MIFVVILLDPKTFEENVDSDFLALMEDMSTLHYCLYMLFINIKYSFVLSS